MMDWTKQTEEMFKTWSDTQKKMWDGWLKAVQQGASMPTQATEMWQKTVKTWEDTMKNMLDAQNEWARLWAEGLANSGVPKEVAEWAQQSQEMTRRWSEAQQQLWESWFDLMKKVDPGKMPEDWDKESQKIFQTWQESTQKIMETQAEWARRWSAVAEEAQAKTSNKKS